MRWSINTLLSNQITIKTVSAQLVHIESKTLFVKMVAEGISWTTPSSRGKLTNSRELTYFSSSSDFTLTNSMHSSINPRQLSLRNCQKLKKNVLEPYFSSLLYIKCSVINFFHPTTAFLQTHSVTKHCTRNPSTQYQVSSTTDWVVLLPSVIHAHLFIEQMHKCSTDLLFCLRPVSPRFPLRKLGKYTDLVAVIVEYQCLQS